MANTLKLEIVTPEGTAFSDDVEMVTMPSIVGQMGVYPQHVPVTTQMEPGELIVHTERRRSFPGRGRGSHRRDWRPRDYLTDLAVAADRIDEAKAEEAR